MPKLVFDFVDGSSGNEKLSEVNNFAIDQIRLDPRVLVNVERRSLKTRFLNIDNDYPFGFAPMGMCNLTWPNADQMLANEAKNNKIPICTSMASSTTLEKIFELSNGRAWLQIYIGQDEQFVMDLIDRAKDCGYKVIILTVDVPVLSRRVRDERNGWNVPFKMGLKQFIDFAFHPNWSFRTLYNGAPKPMNYETSNSGKGFIRGESRGGNDWKTLERLRKKWDGTLVVKGVMNSADAEKIKKSGADAVYVSNHGGRQLDSAPASIYALPLIRKAVGKDYPIIFDSGIRGGGDILKALATGANFVMLGRPLMYAIGADGASGLRKILDVIKGELSTSLGLVGLDDIKKVSNSILAEDFIHKQRKTLDY